MSDITGMRGAETATARILQSAQSEETEEAAKAAEVRESPSSLKEESESVASSALKSRKLEPKREVKKPEKAERAQESVLIRRDNPDMQDEAKRFCRREENQFFRMDEEKLQDLMEELGRGITSETDTETIVKLISDQLSTAGKRPDVAIIDKAMAFLLEVAKKMLDKGTLPPEQQAALQKIFVQLNKAKDEFYKSNQKDIDTSSNVIEVVDTIVEYAQASGVTTSDVLSHIRTIVYDPQDFWTKFNFYKEKGYHYMMKEFKAIFTFSGKRFKDSRIPRGEMSRIIDETKTLQAILQVYRHFKRNTALAQNLFELNGDTLPPYINYETLSGTFVKLVEERYPSAEKALQIIAALLPELLAEELAYQENKKTMSRSGKMRNIRGRIVLLTLMRDAIKEVSPTKVYRSLQHRDDLYLSIIEGLERLEDELEDLEEEELAEEEQQEDANMKNVI